MYILRYSIQSPEPDIGTGKADARARIEKAAKKIKEETGADIDYGYKLYYLETAEEKKCHFSKINGI